MGRWGGKAEPNLKKSHLLRQGGLSAFCCTLIATGQIFPPYRFAIHSAAVYRLAFHLPAAFSRSFLTIIYTHDQKEIKVLYFCNNSYFSSSSVCYISLQNEQIFNRICTKESDSSSSKVSLGKGSTPVIIHSVFHTFSISSPIHTCSYISFSSSQYTKPGCTHQRWC